MTKVISFSSGKGGVGKTTLVSNLGSVWAAREQKVLLIDGDWSLGKLGIALGASPKYNIEHVINGQVELEDAITRVRPHMDLLASPSGVIGFEEITEAQRNQLFFELDGLADKYDLILFDHSSGVNWGVLQFAAASHQHVIVTTAEPTAYTDAYAIMKILSKRFGVREFLIVVTMSGESPENFNIIERFCNVTREKLQVHLNLMEVFPWEQRVSESIRRQKPFVELYPSTALTDKFKQLSSRIDQKACRRHHGLSFFYQSQPNQF